MNLYKELYSIEDTRKIISEELHADFTIEDIIEFWLLDYLLLLLNVKQIINENGVLLDGYQFNIDFELIKKELECLHFKKEDEVLGVYSDLKDTYIEYIKLEDGSIDVIASGLLKAERETATLNKNGIHIGLLGIGHDKKISNYGVPFFLSKIYLNAEIPFSKFKILRSDVLRLINILKENAGLPISSNLNTDTQEKNKNEKLTKYNPTEKETHQQIISSLAFELAKYSHKFKHGERINALAISNAVADYADLFHDAKKAETYRRKISESLAKFS